MINWKWNLAMTFRVGIVLVLGALYPTLLGVGIQMLMFLIVFTLFDVGEYLLARREGRQTAAELYDHKNH